MVDDRPTIAVSGMGFLQNTGRSLILMVVGRDPNRVDQANIQRSGDDRRPLRAIELMPSNGPISRSRQAKARA